MEEDIASAADLQALENRNDVSLLINLVSLGALRTAADSYNLLRRLVYPRNWACPKLGILEGFCGLAIELFYIRNNLLNTAAAAPPNAILEGELLEAFVRMKKMASILQQTKRDNPGIKKGMVLSRAVALGEMLEGLARDVLKGSQTLQVFQDGINNVSGRIDAVLDAPMLF